MPDYIDHCWYGPPEAMGAALVGQANVVGPIVLDGVAYATVRSETALPLPAGLSTVGPNLSHALMGFWMGDDPDVPAQVTRYQGREAMRRTPGPVEGMTVFQAVDAAMNAQGGDALNAWNEVGVFVRSSPMVEQMRQQLGMTNAQVDDLFRLAASINV